MTSPVQTPPIATIIADLYLETGIVKPSFKRPIVPLSELVGSHNLTCAELPALTSQAGMNYLLQHGALIEPPEQVDQEPLAGFLYAYDSFGCIFVERDDPFVRRRFSVAHELGHYLLHFCPLLGTEAVRSNLTLIEAVPRTSQQAEDIEDLPSGQITFTTQTELPALIHSQEQMERDANQFAAELLMPANVLQELAAHYTPLFQGQDLIWRLATDLLVSKAAMRRRLQDLGLLFTKASMN
jgi:hypothetical protein